MSRGGRGISWALHTQEAGRDVPSSEHQHIHHHGRKAACRARQAASFLQRVGGWMLDATPAATN